MDYRRLNKITIKNRYSVPMINRLLDYLYIAKYSIKIDLRKVYCLLSICKGNEWKITFWIPHKLFEFLVMPFGLYNISVSFQEYIDQAL